MINRWLHKKRLCHKSLLGMHCKSLAECGPLDSYDVFLIAWPFGVMALIVGWVVLR